MVTTLPALEAVQAAKEQGSAASHQLDLALRQAFFRDSRCISLISVVVDVAASCPAVDEGLIGEALGDGRARRAVSHQMRAARAIGVHRAASPGPAPRPQTRTPGRIPSEVRPHGEDRAGGGWGDPPVFE